jgi:hypothetical protein
MMATSENQSEWLRSAFMEDRLAVQMEGVQGDRQFLRTGVHPTAGQRVEVKILLNADFAPPTTTSALSSGKNKGKTKKHKNNNNKESLWCGFSGQVTRVKPAPAKWFPMSHKDDTAGSKALTAFLGSMLSDHMPTITSENLLSNSTISSCPCNYSACNHGELFMPQQDWVELQDKVELDLSIPLNMFGGVKHGQEVVCEGRLNFDHDSTYIMQQDYIIYCVCVLLHILT